MKNYQSKYLWVFTLLIAAYYLICSIYLSKLGYITLESLFYIEKTKIVLDGLGNRLKVMGLTAPIIPFYASVIFSLNSFLSQFAPVIASSVCTALLFYLMASTLLKNANDDFYFIILFVVFICHPGILYAACSGKSIALVLIFFYLFFFNLLKFYHSNTTFHISIASICLVILTFCDFKFIWLTLFFIPLILSITLQSLNLGEQESIFRLFISFNNPSLRRKLLNKTFALYIIVFILPLSCVFCYKLLNQTHASDFNYFSENPYATWTVLADKISFDNLSTSTYFKVPETSLLISLSILAYCPLILVAVYLFKDSVYQILTLITPFAFVEFLHIKFDKVFLVNEYYLIFLVLSLLCIFYKAHTAKNKTALKLIVSIATVVQLYTGYAFLKNSFIGEEQHFITIFLNRTTDSLQDQNRGLASYINGLPDDEHILVDDANAYPVVAYVDNIQKLTLPYQNLFLSAIETPDKYDKYMLLANEKNEFTGFSQLNNKYIPIIKAENSAIKVKKVYETDDWTLYEIFDQ